MIKRALWACWAFPVVLAGYVLAHAWCAVGWGRARPGSLWGFPEARIIWAAGPVARWFARRNWQAFTFARIVWIWRHPLPTMVLRDLLQHEVDGHVMQWLRYGILMPFVYLYQLARYGYHRRDQKLPLERDARRAADEP